MLEPRGFVKDTDITAGMAFELRSSLEYEHALATTDISIADYKFSG